MNENEYNLQRFVDAQETEYATALNEIRSGGKRSHWIWYIFLLRKYVYLVDYYNSYSRETYDIIPVTTCDLSPETEELFRMDDYPERFFKWAEKFINITI